MLRFLPLKRSPISGSLLLYLPDAPRSILKLNENFRLNPKQLTANMITGKPNVDPARLGAKVQADPEMIGSCHQPSSALPASRACISPVVLAISLWVICRVEDSHLLNWKGTFGRLGRTCFSSWKNRFGRRNTDLALMGSLRSGVILQ